MGKPATALIVGTCVVMVGCSDTTPNGPAASDATPQNTVPPAGLTISNPIAGAGATGSATRQSVTYVSASPGTFAADASLVLRNRDDNSHTMIVPVVDGGFDPVIVRANAGDDLELTVIDPSGSSRLSVFEVPSRQRPTVVRTSLLRGEAEVPLNASVTIVFSEPLDASSVTPTAFVMQRQGATVGGSIRMSHGGAAAVFTPSLDLLHNERYDVLVRQDLRDLNGDHLAAESALWFSTVTSGPTIPIANISISSPHASYTVGIATQLEVSVRDRFGKPLERVVSWTSSNPHVATISSQGLLTPIAVGTSTVSASSGGRSAGLGVTVVHRVPLPAEFLFVDRSTNNIVRTDLNRRSYQQLTFTGRNSEPQYSPDGSRIAFVREIDAPGLYVMDDYGLNVMRIASGGYRNPAWSPDGRTLAVSSGNTSYSSIHLFSPIAADARPVHLLEDARSPAWSPDGQAIAFVRTSGDDGYHEVFAMNADGSGMRSLSGTDAGAIHTVSWSPDGSRLAFSKCLVGDCELYMVNADGSGLRRMTDIGHVRWAAWSPDGQWIAMMLRNDDALADNRPKIAVIPAAGGAISVLIDNAVEPSWRPLPFNR